MGILAQTYNEVMEKPLQVLEVFNEFFGEDRVDLQGFPTLDEVKNVFSDDVESETLKTWIDNIISVNTTSFDTSKRSGFILVHFPHVTITNENDRFVEANHFYAKIIIDIEGKIVGRFLLNRADYSKLHFENNYMHSHICDIPTWNFTDFQTPCTGSGPINHTICSLSIDCNLDLWRLFCLELDKFMQVESISGTPYHRLENLVPGGYNGHSITVYNVIRMSNMPRRIFRDNTFITREQWADFIKYIIDSNTLKFTYQEGAYMIAMSPNNFYITISNLFIKWYNLMYKRGEVSGTMSDLLLEQIIGEYKFSEGKIVRNTGRSGPNWRNFVGAAVCKFKGQVVYLTISDIDETEESQQNNLIMLHQGAAEYILTKILNVINYRYDNNRKEGDETDKAVHFL